MIGSNNKELTYYDTLSPFLNTDKYGENYKAPANYDEWMTREVFPAATAFFNYYTDPQTVYSSWSPFDKSSVSKSDTAYQYADDDPKSEPE